MAFDTIAIMEYERSLLPGSMVEVRWTNCNRFHRCKAIVNRVNKSSINVSLAEEYTASSGAVYPVGQTFSVPRLTMVTLSNSTWSDNNRVVKL